MIAKEMMKISFKFGIYAARKMKEKTNWFNLKRKRNWFSDKKAIFLFLDHLFLKKFIFMIQDAVK